MLKKLLSYIPFIGKIKQYITIAIIASLGVLCLSLYSEVNKLQSKNSELTLKISEQEKQGLVLSLDQTLKLQSVNSEVTKEHLEKEKQITIVYQNKKKSIKQKINEIEKEVQQKYEQTPPVTVDNITQEQIDDLKSDQLQADKALIVSKMIFEQLFEEKTNEKN